LTARHQECGGDNRGNERGKGATPSPYPLQEPHRASDADLSTQVRLDGARHLISGRESFS
jgi:hypothetical protein